MTGPVFALDLGSTALKGGILESDGRWRRQLSAPAPPLTGAGLVRESDPRAWLGLAARMYKDLAREMTPGSALALASQRSSFLLWEKFSGRPLTPLISWQDRRALDWCAGREAAHAVLPPAGLPLSPHYAAPKLAQLLEAHPEWRAGMRAGRILFGTLECWIGWQLTGGVHATDLTLAARTLLADPALGDWSPERLDFFGVPRAGLPEIFPTVRARLLTKEGYSLRVSVGDQPAAAWLLLTQPDDRLVNLGTGAFVLRRADEFTPPPGVLSGPLPGASFAWEGTINGAASALEPFGIGPTEFPAADESPDAFCIPDDGGLGAPHWKPALGFTLSEAAKTLPIPAQRRIVLEGILFRLKEVLDGLGDSSSAGRILVTGGLTRDPALGPALAALLGRGVQLVDEPDATLLGAARLAADLPPGLAAREIAPAGDAGAYLAKKYFRWERWLHSRL